MFISDRIVLTQYILGVTGLNHFDTLCYIFSLFIFCVLLGLAGTIYLKLVYKYSLKQWKKSLILHIYFKCLFNPANSDVFLIPPQKNTSQSFLFFPSYVTSVVLNVWIHMYISICIHMHIWIHTHDNKSSTSDSYQIHDLSRSGQHAESLPLRGSCWDVVLESWWQRLKYLL